MLVSSIVDCACVGVRAFMSSETAGLSLNASVCHILWRGKRNTSGHTSNTDTSTTAKQREEIWTGGSYSGEQHRTFTASSTKASKRNRQWLIVISESCAKAQVQFLAEAHPDYCEDKQTMENTIGASLGANKEAGWLSDFLRYRLGQVQL